jgi:hypothetical protein
MQREMPATRAAIHAADVIGSGAAAAAAAAGSDSSATGGAGAASPHPPLLRQASSIGASGVPDLQLNCLVAIIDPPRDEAISAVRSCHSAGITVKVR